MVGPAASHSEATRSHDDRTSDRPHRRALGASPLSSVYRLDVSAAAAAVNHRPALPLPNKVETPSLSSRSSSGSSSGEATDTPSTPTVNSTPSTTHANVKPTPLTALRRQRPDTAASSAPTATGKMLNDDFALPLVNVGASSSSSSKNIRILGPDGQLYTQGEAAKLGLIIRTACEACRNRKLKCSGTLPENGGCGRCNSDGIQCVYSARAPIGRPKKRKGEQEAGPSSKSPVTSGKSKANRKHSASSSLGDISARIKTEEATPFDSPASSQAALSFASSPALQHIHNSAYFSSGQASLPVSPAQSDRLQQRTLSHDGSPAGFVAPHPFGLYDSPMHAPSAPESSSSSARLVSTPTVWSQHPAAFSMTPSDTTTPHSIISPALASTSYADAQHAQQQPAPHANPSASAAKLPSLDDLSVAAFLQSLDTLEISPAELFQQQQQQQQVQPFSNATSSSGTPNAVSAYGLGTPFHEPGSGVSAGADRLTASSLEEWATSSAILQPGLSFAVPADFSWWDLGINGADLGAGSAAASVSAMPSTEIGAMAFPTSGAVQAHLPMASVSQGQSGGSGGVVDGPGVVGPSSSAATLLRGSGKSRRPTFNADQLWPRGADAGMGQGQIQHTVAATETGLGWSTLPGPSQLAGAMSSPVESQAGGGGERGSCCSSKPAKAAAPSPAEAKSDGASESVAEKPSCCSSKPAVETSSEGPPKPASCCSGKGKHPAQQSQDPKPCCSGHATPPPTTTPSTAIEMGPLSTSAAVHGAPLHLDSERQRHAASHAHHPSKVHCVPNPSGKGCTCLCDMSVALLSVKQVLRETDPHPARIATDTIQLTLTASQAITAQCACSADCPTCQSDPSTEISASLLVSTALQIYARAVRILREGLSASKGEAVKGFFGGLEVTIGTYKPSVGNAKKIALYAIKLELKDLRRALGKISRMAQNLGVPVAAKGGEGRDKAASEGEGEGEGEGEKGEKAKQGQGMNPIDQLVILKLYRQLTELLKTIEGLEDAA
ncbi:conserved hypothetical protein [Sporisorium reilianum SRZ2]|uniref:Zn(2)-C6 fungal-type domain-containing protein n=1 Tax=Sporisorium reilianum (strain SRZ2) TaxID=999809 RepID=E6ZMJ9_SPORE|nr:conserved hypothetical protein [Sporisorium reilianum SRZ2]